MKEEECKECSVICAECKYGNGMTCGFYTKNEMNCVTGKKEQVWAQCIDHNKDGKCKAFNLDEDKASRRRLLSALDEECRRNSSKPHSYPDCYGDILHELISYLEGYNQTLRPFCYNQSKREKCGGLK